MGKVCDLATPITNVNGIEINRSKPCNSSNYTAESSRTIDYIVMHYTGNSKDSAGNNANYFMGANRQASAHYFVDDTSIWQSVDANDRAWHCGDVKYYHDEARNYNSIGIEMCCTAGNYKIGPQALENSAQLAATLCKYFDITDVDKYVIRHYDVTHKICPAQMVNNSSEWTAFKNRVKEILNVEPVVAKEYQVLTNINRYASASDALLKTNSKGTYDVGVYYIFNKYPNGIDGMLNITKDTTGSAAGSWINPSENVAQEPEIEVEKLYRVRKTKDDATTQKGAFANLDNAKECCQEAGEGYHVFDWDYNIVYSYQAPEVPAEPVAVYDLDYPVKTKIVELDKKQDDNELKANCVKSIKSILKNNANFDINIAKAFFALAPVYGINPMMAISQSILETGWFKYVGSAVTADQHNYCGMGVTSNGVTGSSFDTIENGVRAQLQHLYAYGCKDSLPEGEETIIDPRFKYVTRGIAPYWQNLAGRWAVPGYDKNTYATPEDAMNAGNTYGQKIYTICTNLNSAIVSDDDMEKYFPTEKPEEPVNTDNTLNNNIAYVFSILRKIFEAIINIFKGNK